MRCPFCSTHLDASHPSLSALTHLLFQRTQGWHQWCTMHEHIRPLCCHNVVHIQKLPLWTPGRWSGLQFRLLPVVVRGCRFMPFLPRTSRCHLRCHFWAISALLFCVLATSCWRAACLILTRSSSCFGIALWMGDSPPSPPRVGTQSWFFCPLISIALGAVELSRGVSMYEFGRRSPVPDDQVVFWTHQAPDLLVAIVQHFAALSAGDPVMTVLQSEHAWVGGHLADSFQLAATPQHIQSLMELWLANAVSSFATPTAIPPPALESTTLASSSLPFSQAMANFGQTNVGQNQVWPNQVWPIPSLATFGQYQVWPNELWPSQPVLMFCSLSSVSFSSFLFSHGTPSPGPPVKNRTGPPRTALRRTAQCFALHHYFHSFSPLLGVFSLNFGGVLKTGTLKRALWSSLAVV